MWPDPNPKARFHDELFTMHQIMPRIELILTEEEFEALRHSLKLDGFELHDIERVPYSTPQNVV
jgi:hypothetical protein